MHTRAEIGPLFKRACRGVELDQAVPLNLNLSLNKDTTAANHSVFTLSLTDDLILLYYLVLCFCFPSCAERPPKQK